VRPVCVLSIVKVSLPEPSRTTISSRPV
jgi:hypothetical protein